MINPGHIFILLPFEKPGFIEMLSLALVLDVIRASFVQGLLYLLPSRMAICAGTKKTIFV